MMPSDLKKLLYADLERQDFYANQANASQTLMRLIFKSFTPRFAPVVLYRLSHHFHCVGVGVLAKFFSLINFVFFGLEVAARCEIGPGLFFPHTVGTVIGAERIGSRAVIYHNVTLGAKEIDVAYLDAKRPTIGDDVLIGAGSKILGGVLVGDRVRIGANAVVLSDVPKDTVAVGIPAVFKTKIGVGEG